MREGFDPKTIARLKKRIPAFATAVNNEMKAALKKQGQWWFGRMADRFRAPLTPYGQHNPHDILHNRSGFLRGSLHHRVEGQKLNELRLHMWTDAPYAQQQEFGGRITPKKRKYMAIPIDDNLTPAGVRKHNSPLDPSIVDGFFLEVAGNLYYVRHQGRRSRKGSQTESLEDLQFLFAMRKEVRIRPRLGMGRTALGREARSQMNRRIGVAARNAIKKSLAAKGTN